MTSTMATISPTTRQSGRISVSLVWNMTVSQGLERRANDLVRQVRKLLLRFLA